MQSYHNEWGMKREGTAWRLWPVEWNHSYHIWASDQKSIRIAGFDDFSDLSFFDKENFDSSENIQIGNKTLSNDQITGRMEMSMSDVVDEVHETLSVLRSHLEQFHLFPGGPAMCERAVHRCRSVAHVRKHDDRNLQLIWAYPA